MAQSRKRLGFALVIAQFDSGEYLAEAGAAHEVRQLRCLRVSGEEVQGNRGKDVNAANPDTRNHFHGANCTESAGSVHETWAEGRGVKFALRTTTRQGR
eukprot:1366270-Rhodomonas_salina.8